MSLSAVGDCDVRGHTADGGDRREPEMAPLSNDEARFGQVADDRLDDIVAENAERNTAGVTP